MGGAPDFLQIKVVRGGGRGGLPPLKAGTIEILCILFIKRAPLPRLKCIKYV